VARLIGGSGVVIAFALLLFGLMWATGAKTGAAEFGSVTLVGLALIQPPRGSGRATLSTD
jgi:hypothetical protein